ncbi:7912_t:CDS:1, partial [Racocetra persica]
NVLSSKVNTVSVEFTIDGKDWCVDFQYFENFESFANLVNFEKRVKQQNFEKRQNFEKK